MKQNSKQECGRCSRAVLLRRKKDNFYYRKIILIASSNSQRALLLLVAVAVWLTKERRRNNERKCIYNSLPMHVTATTTAGVPLSLIASVWCHQAVAAWEMIARLHAAAVSNTQGHYDAGYLGQACKKMTLYRAEEWSNQPCRTFLYQVLHGLLLPISA